MDIYIRNASAGGGRPISKQQYILKKRKGRAKLYDHVLKVRTTLSESFLIDAIALFEQREATELLRSWILEKRQDYTKNSTFRRWIRRHKEDLRLKGIPLEEIF